GAFDIRNGGAAPRPTPLARLAQRLAFEQLPQWASVAQPGWWERPDRLLYPPVDREGNDVLNGRRRPRRRARDSAA
ncbi:MAG: hypothetical protein H0V00_06735, partial [Chloroflexia bacterium]|nr:hypothetical protein [Chloroflexia bacterium]